MLLLFKKRIFLVSCLLYRLCLVSLAFKAGIQRSDTQKSEPPQDKQLAEFMALLKAGGNLSDRDLEAIKTKLTKSKESPLLAPRSYKGENENNSTHIEVSAHDQKGNCPDLKHFWLVNHIFGADQRRVILIAWSTGWDII